MERLIIRSRQNPRVKELRRLATRKGRWAERLFLAEGGETVREALKAGMALAVAVDEERREEHADLIAQAEGAGIEVLLLAPGLYGHVTTTTAPPGILAVCPFVHVDWEALPASEPDTLILAVRPRDPGNLGTLIRTAAAAFAGGVVVTGSSVDLYNPKVVRATMGGVFLLPLALASHPESVIEEAKRKGYAVVASVPRGGEDLFFADLTGRLLLVLGGEVEGLPSELLSLCDRLVSIPMRRETDSLNLAAAAAVLIYEALRQKRTSAS